MQPQILILKCLDNNSNYLCLFENSNFSVFPTYLIYKLTSFNNRKKKNMRNWDTKRLSDFL